MKNLPNPTVTTMLAVVISGEVAAHADQAFVVGVFRAGVMVAVAGVVAVATARSFAKLAG